ncbi:hypothetical protein BOTBODRAFT_39070 [Botryobasidium botryosum FD-172 SS1]|uniref:Uncharacterized protein n=1 Tax=Botryobasidium botryosum (strain FD-172 SS1) TaxID=930990 RepID=A0A067M6D0_BOTB1|nr:hypothetical protein BOTBODRAFT_39070 [Botryobasidium botryosum FD-172 SS1]
MHDRNIRRVERVFPRRVLLEVERRFDYIPRTWIPRPSTRALRIQYGNALGAQYPQDPPLILPVGHPSYGKQVVVRDPEAQLPPWQVAALHQCTKALGDPCTLKVSCTVTWTSYTLYDRINAFFEFLEAVPWATLLHHWALACVSPHSSRHLRFSDPENAAFAACIVDAWLSAVGLHDL